jgi:hypothetical protein
VKRAVPWPDSAFPIHSTYPMSRRSDIQQTSRQSLGPDLGDRRTIGPSKLLLSQMIRSGLAVPTTLHAWHLPLVPVAGPRTTLYSTQRSTKTLVNSSNPHLELHWGVHIRVTTFKKPRGCLSHLGRSNVEAVRVAVVLKLGPVPVASPLPKKR